MVGDCSRCRHSFMYHFPLHGCITFLCTGASSVTVMSSRHGVLDP